MKSSKFIVSQFYSYWGKAANKDEENAFHLLPYHCLDVAAVANCYLAEHPHLLTSISVSLGFPLLDTKSLLLFLITLHDLGKFSVCFQSIAPDALKTLSPETEIRRNSSYYHDVLGQVLWREHLIQLFFRDHIVCNKDDDFSHGFNTLMGSSTGHHGEPTFTDTQKNNSYMESFDKENIDAATQFYHVIDKLFLSNIKFDLTGFDDEDDFLTRCRRLSWWLSGLTILSDWLGSNTKYFKYENEVQSLDSYWEKTNEIARKSITESGLNHIDIKKNQTFQAIFNKQNLRPSQQLATTINLSNQAQLFILEDVTGTGKTEAALMLAYRLMEKGLADGIYFGLPTMATANGIYDRLKNIYKHFFETPDLVSIVLAHANNKLAKEFHDSIGVHPIEEKILKGELDTATAFCNAWIVDNRKKALLANIGVGTIDQALQSILPNKHQSLRLLGLFQKILIVDEVHAYDDYMQELLGSLLKFHAASGGSAILLTATLSKKMRQKLANNFSDGRGFKHYFLQKNDYPLLTHVYEGKADEVSIKALPEFKREVDVRLIDNKDEIEKYIFEQLQQGCCVCWIRNTVHDAIETYEKFQIILPPDKITLFHARFTMQDRYEIEDKVKDLFGVTSSLEQRSGQLLIATQVVEQSLDLDFDCMITDLAPIDLIIQRAGRLQRHKRGEKRCAPILLIYGPLPRDDVQEDWYGAFFEKGKWVYENPEQLWLGAKLLADKQKLVMPDDARELVECVYSNACELIAPSCFTKQTDKHLGKQHANSNHGKSNVNKLDAGYERTSTDSWSNDARTTTRLNNEEHINVYLAKLENDEPSPWCKSSDFAWQKSSLNIALRHLEKKAKGLPESPVFSSKEITELLEKLPDKGRYSALLLFNPDTKIWILVRDGKSSQVDHIDYVPKKGFLTNK